LSGVDFSPTTSALDPNIQTALDVIQTEAPLYQTSFDSWEFGDPVDNARLENGKLIVNGGTDRSTFVQLYDLSSDRFVVEFELRVLKSGPVNRCILGVSNGIEEPGRGLNFGFDSNGQANLNHYDHLVNNFQNLVEDEYEDLKINAFTLIIIGDQIVTLVNGKIVYTAIDPAGNAMYTDQHIEADIEAICEYDNFKIWDLSNVDLNP
jgi:hypothetical protein